ncbi:MAG: MliC family protein [Bacteroidetes bacterium]|nr:MliC family protein [Bacteroidota bacterium]
MVYSIFYIKTKHIKIVAALLFIFLSASCKEIKLANKTDEIVTSTATDENGKILTMVFNNTKNTATLTLERTAIKLKRQIAASGIWYINKHYELRGKGKDILVTKDGVILFKNY